MTSQRVPAVSPADVERIVARDFAKGTVPVVRGLLERHRQRSVEAGSARVQLAALKHAGGDLARLEQALENALTDWRDVVAAAEYPRYLASRPGDRQTAAREAIVEADWNAYQDWLQRG